MASYSLAEVAVPLAKGRSARVAMYARPGAMYSSVLAISPPCAAEALDDDCFLHELWASLSDTNPGGGAIARFALFADGSQDSWTEASSYSPEQLARLRSFVRARLFDVWHGMAPELARLSGTFEMMNPAHGANMGWHQDGHGAGEYITHYYLGSPAGPGEASAPRPVAEGTGWCEVALPPLGADTAEAVAEAVVEAVAVARASVMYSSATVALGLAADARAAEANGNALVPTVRIVHAAVAPRLRLPNCTPAQSPVGSRRQASQQKAGRAAWRLPPDAPMASGPVIVEPLPWLLP